MAQNTVEILIKARDQFTDTTQKAKADLLAMKVAADQFNQSVDKMMKSHPSLTRQEAIEAVDALDQMKNAADQTGHSYTNARIAAQGLGDLLHIQLPRAVTTFLSQSSLIGPALTAAFSGIAVVGLIEAIARLPEAIEKVRGALTGWDEQAQKAYERMVDDNNKLLKSYRDIEGELIRIRGAGAGPFEAASKSVQELEGDLAPLQRHLKDAQDELKAMQQQASATFGTFFGPVLGPLANRVLPTPMLPSQRSESEIKSDIEKYTKLANDKAAELLAARGKQEVAQTEFTIAQTKERLKAEEELARAKERLEQMAFDSQVGHQIYLQKEREQELRDAENLAEAKERLEQMAFDSQLGHQIYLQKEREKEEADAKKAADEQIRVFEKQVEAQKRRQEEAQRAQEKLIKTIRDDAGRVFDELFTRGKGFIDLLKDGLAAVGRNLFRDLAQAFILGRGSLGGGSLLGGILGTGTGGGLLGGVLGRVGAVTPPFVPGGTTGGILGGLGALGGLFGHGVGAAPGAIGVLNPATGALETGGGILGAGGIGASLGLHGGAGLLGLGAATIPVVGAVAAGVIFGLTKLFGHQTQEAPFTQDPNDPRSREYFFYTGSTMLMDAARDISRTMGRFNTVNPGVVVKDGLPIAIQSSNQFRRDLNSKLQDDI